MQALLVSIFQLFSYFAHPLQMRLARLVACLEDWKVVSEEILRRDFSHCLESSPTFGHVTCVLRDLAWGPLSGSAKQPLVHEEEKMV